MSTLIECGRVVLLCGLPGAGKSTLARRLAVELPAVRLCPDEWLVALGADVFDETARERVEALQWLHALELATLGTTAVLENGFWSRRERDGLRAQARDRGLMIELRHLDVPSAELHRRVALRNTEPGQPLITPEMLTEYQALFEPPSRDELALYDAPLAALTPPPALPSPPALAPSPPPPSPASAAEPSSLASPGAPSPPGSPISLHSPGAFDPLSRPPSSPADGPPTH